MSDTSARLARIRANRFKMMEMAVPSPAMALTASTESSTESSIAAANNATISRIESVENAPDIATTTISFVKSSKVNADTASTLAAKSNGKAAQSRPASSIVSGNATSTSSAPSIPVATFNLDDFLMYLAINASPDRFYPFPPQYRTNKDVGQPLAIFQTHDTNFSEYAPSDYATMLKDLKAIRDAGASDKLPDHLRGLKTFVTRVGVNIVNHVADPTAPYVECEFVYAPIVERIRDAQTPKRWYLFHGSGLGNWHSILRNGIKSMSATKFQTTGAAYGNGVYLSDTLAISAGYGNSGSHTYKNLSNITCVCVVEVLCDPASFKRTDHIYVVPNDKLIVARYLWIIERQPNYTEVDKLLNYYATLRRPAIVHENRMAHELMSLREKYADVLCVADTANANGANGTDGANSANRIMRPNLLQSSDKMTLTLALTRENIAALKKRSVEKKIKLAIDRATDSAPPKDLTIYTDDYPFKPPLVRYNNTYLMPVDWNPTMTLCDVLANCAIYM